MKQWNNMVFEERIETWKGLRSEIEVVDSSTAPTVVNDFFFDMPICARCIDFYTPETWPSPWEILHSGLFCKSGISLLMAHTLLINDPDINMELILIDDQTDKYLTPLVNGKLLNVWPGEMPELSELSGNVTVHQTFNKEQLKKILI